MTHALGWWVIPATLNLHFTGSSFVTHAIAESNADASAAAEHMLLYRRRPRCGFAVVAWAGSRSRHQRWMTSAAFCTGRGHYIGVQLDRGLLPWLLAIPWPTPHSTSRPMLGRFLPVTGLGAGRAGIALLRVLHSEVSFEEASISRAEKRATRVRAIQ